MMVSAEVFFSCFHDRIAIRFPQAAVHDAVSEQKFWKLKVDDRWINNEYWPVTWFSIQSVDIS